MKLQRFVLALAATALIAGLPPTTHANGFEVNFSLFGKSPSPKPSASASSGESAGARSTRNIIIGVAGAAIISILADHYVNRQYNLAAAQSLTTSMSSMRANILYLAALWVRQDDSNPKKAAALAYYDQVASNWNAFLYQKAATSTTPSTGGTNASPAPTPSGGRSTFHAESLAFTGAIAQTSTAPSAAPSAAPTPTPVPTPPTLEVTNPLFDQIVDAHVLLYQQYDAFTAYEVIEQGNQFQQHFPNPLVENAVAHDLFGDCGKVPASLTFGDLQTYVTCGVAIVNWGDAQLRAMSTRQACELLSRVWLPPSSKINQYADAIVQVNKSAPTTLGATPFIPLPRTECQY